MFSDKYLFVQGAVIKKFVTAHNPYAIRFHCPDCDKTSAELPDKNLLEESGSMAKYMVFKCTCGTIYHYVN